MTTQHADYQDADSLQKELIHVLNLCTSSTELTATSYSIRFWLRPNSRSLRAHRAELGDGAGHDIEIEPQLEARCIEPAGDVLWYVVQSDNPDLIANQITISPQGNMAVTIRFSRSDRPIFWSSAARMKANQVCAAPTIQHGLTSQAARTRDVSGVINRAIDIA